MKTISVKLRKDVLKEIQRISLKTGLDREVLINKALLSFLKNEAKELEKSVRPFTPEYF